MNPALIMMIGSMLQAGGSAYGSLMAVKNSKYFRDAADAYAGYVGAVTNIQAARIDRIRDQTISAQRAQTAASGISPLEGAPVDLAIETDILADIDKNLLRMSGSMEALRYRTEGRMGEAAGYGQAAQLGAQGFGSLLSTGMSYGQRQGWFAPKQESMLSSGPMSIPVQYRSSGGYV